MDIPTQYRFLEKYGESNGLLSFSVFIRRSGLDSVSGYARVYDLKVTNVGILPAIEWLGVSLTNISFLSSSWCSMDYQELKMRSKDKNNVQIPKYTSMMPFLCSII